MTGTVKFFDVTKRWGFISGDDNSEIFVHEADVPEGQRPLNKGDKVSYEIGNSPKGLKATCVSVTKRAPTRRPFSINR